MDTKNHDCYKSRNNALKYLANKAGSYKMFYDLPWIYVGEDMYVATDTFSVYHEVRNGRWKVRKMYDDHISFHSIEQAIAYVDLLWWS